MKLINPYFPAELKYGAVLAVGAGIYLAWSGHLIWGVVLAVLALILFSTEYVTEFDSAGRTITDYIRCLWIPFNREVIRYGAIDKIVITKGRFAQTINTRAQSRQLDWVAFTAVLIFQNNDPFDLLTKNRKRDLLLGIRDVASYLQADVEDLTTSRSYFIDLSKVE